MQRTGISTINVLLSSQKNYKTVNTVSHYIFISKIEVYYNFYNEPYNKLAVTDNVSFLELICDRSIIRRAKIGML